MLNILYFISPPIIPTKSGAGRKFIGDFNVYTSCDYPNNSTNSSRFTTQTYMS